MRARFCLTGKGNSVTAGVHPMGDLAPRDVVAAAIDARLRATGDPCVYLDARGIDDFERRFPTVTAACRAAGIDPTRATDSGGAGRALQLRRRGHRRARPHRAARACSRRARWPAPACTARTGWRPTACWRAWSSAAGQGKAAADTPSMPGRATRRCLSSRRASRLAAGRPAACDVPLRVGGPRRRRPASGWRRNSTAATPTRSRARRDFEDAALTVDRPRGRGRGAGPHRDPRLPSPLRLPGHRPGAGAQPGALAAARWSVLMEAADG